MSYKFNPGLDIKTRTDPAPTPPHKHTKKFPEQSWA